MKEEFELYIGKENGSIQKIMATEGMTLEEVKNQYMEDSKDPIVLALYNGKLRELHRRIQSSGEIRFLTMQNKDGKRTYRRSIMILMQRAVRNLWDLSVRVRVLYSLGQSYYCEFEGKEMTAQTILALKIEMLRLVDENLPITKTTVDTVAAEEMFAACGMRDKERLLHYRRCSKVNLYELDGMQDYYYGYMVPSTGYLKYFDLQLYENGFVVTFPNKNSTITEPLVTSSKLFHTLKKSRNWSRMLGVGTVGALNDAISEGKGEKIILLQESLMEEQIGSLATRIAEDRSKKFVMIAGPSSSGKTTFSNRLSIQLLARGLHPHAVGLDDYYADREKCPRDEFGKLDFECLEALDVEQFNHDMQCLLAGEEVDMPSFNFKTGKREYNGRRLRLGPEDILVIEGIHGLNDKLSYMMPAESTYRIYISALTQLNIDEHNSLSTTDARLIRRIVRDARTRGTSARETIAMWDSVRRGEEKYIFPFQEGADYFFNSALVYELAVLKKHIFPLLTAVQPEDECYEQVRNIVKVLNFVQEADVDDEIPPTSLVREFIGGNTFYRK